MRKRYMLGAGVALAMAFSWAAQAQLFVMPSGPGALYFGIEGGWTHLEDTSNKLGGIGFKQRFDEGFNAGARAGYEWGPLRFEEEFNFGSNKDTRLSILGANVPISGQRNRYAIMTNAIYDFTLGWPITPHLGVGIGAVNLRDSMSTKPPFAVTLASNSQWEFGYQAIAGIRYNINPALAFDLDYRYLATTDPTFRTVTGAKYKSEYSTHNVVASLSVRFGAPPPAPPAPPPPPILARKVFLVFFDWDRDTITPEGRAIIAQAADAWRAGGNVTIQVTGYTDASGSAGYNQRLSERRANNVANALAQSGVPRQAMVVSGRGKNDQRVPTADGVREPQNRRVEIVFP
ncbi:MAG TPA: OmpA family protein [Xanthobacteraceae bacterium]|nr:OmpA family protein [Xanthobacteraceae bacterium]